MRKLIRENSHPVYVDLSQVEAIDDIKAGNTCTIVNLRMASSDNHTIIVPDNNLDAFVNEIDKAKSDAKDRFVYNQES